jgi:hypothetical protein
MYLIQKGKKPQVQCASCKKLCVARLKRQQRVGMVCDSCIDQLVAEAVEKYTALVR